MRVSPPAENQDYGSNVSPAPQDDTGGGGGGAPTNAEYVVISLDATLTNERRLQATTPIVLTDGGANADATLTHATSGVVAATYGSASQVPVFAVNATGHVTSVTNTPVVLSGVGVNLYGILGNGEDGAVTLDGAVTPSWASRSGSTYTLTRQPLCTDLTVNVGVTLKMGNLSLFCNGTLTNNGNINNDGNDAVGVSGGSATAALFWPATANGSSGTGTTAPSTAANTTNSLGATGGAGGSSPSGAGANPGSVSVPTPSNGGVAHSMSIVGALNGRIQGAGSIGGGSGGGGGRGDASGNAGGGGAGGGLLAVFCRTLAGNGTISCDGGDGGSPAVANVNGGGGGAGGGGAVFIITGTASPGSVNTITANPGTPGAGKGTGASGSAGAAGRVIVIQLLA